MTWVQKRNGRPIAEAPPAAGVVVAEYECPVHGRFSHTVTRDEHGDPPDEVWCTSRLDEPQPGAWVVLDDDEWDRRCSRPLVCGRASPWRPTPVLGRVQRVTAARRGKDPEAPPNTMDWKALAYDERPPEEVAARERKRNFEHVRKVIDKAVR